MEAPFQPHGRLIALGGGPLEDLRDTFAGVVITSATQDLSAGEGYTTYVVGDVLESCTQLGLSPLLVLAVEGYCSNYDGCVTVPLGQVPIHIQGIGVLYPQFFTKDAGMYEQLTAAHTFQTLKEGSKPSVSYRRGIYITRVSETERGTEFKLLRCSTNLGGPTDNVRPVDDVILSVVNDLRVRNFPVSAELNHVLAQEYHNCIADDSGKMVKASISAHSDKTSDMPKDAAMAFVTFYDWKGVSPPSCVTTKPDSYDALYKGKTCIYTRLLWRLKDGVEPSATHPAEVSVVLPPGSVLLVSLAVNRLYTHETRPSVLPVDKIPTRLSYVVRSSKTVAVHRDEGTFIKTADGTFEPMRAPTAHDLDFIREKYVLENKSVEDMDYGAIMFSMNDGDYLCPTL
jgi:hypothetical protein